MKVKELPKGKFLITLSANPKSSIKQLAKALEDIHMRYGGFQYIPLAYHKNGQLKSLLAFCKEMFFV